MKLGFWLVVVMAAAGLAYWQWHWRQRMAERKRASDERLSAFVAQAMVATPKVDAAQKLLLDAAAKAAQAGEVVLSIQLYARLLARYPECAFASQARSAVAELKKKLAKA